MACGSPPATCRREHIAALLDDAEHDGEDFEARCPACGHGGFRISKPAVRKYRHIWTCACKRCGRGRGCPAGILRVHLLRLDIPPACLGLYDGAAAKEIGPEVARLMDLAINDILAVPRLRPADMRLVLAEAQGRKVPDEYTEFVKFAKSIGIGHQQAYEAARRWIGRPPDLSPPQTGGGVVDTSHNTGPAELVKPLRSRQREATETVDAAYGDRRETGEIVATETVERTLGNNKNRRPAA